jgi:ferredoxin
MKICYHITPLTISIFYVLLILKTVFYIILLTEVKSMPKVKVNPELCGSCGLCVGSRPEVFEFDEEGRAKAVAECEGELGFECPFGAIDVE